MLSYDYVYGRLETSLRSYTRSSTESSDTFATIARVLMKKLRSNARGYAGVVLSDVVRTARKRLARENHMAVSRETVLEYLGYVQWDTGIRYMFPDTRRYRLVSALP